MAIQKQMNVLISGGAGFIGGHLATRLASAGMKVTLLDNFSPQIHGDVEGRKQQLSAVATVVTGDVRDRGVWEQLLPEHEVVVHLAAETGTGQSMYQVSHYEAVNLGGTALMFDVIVNAKLSNVRNVVVASSRAIYGEGRYQCEQHGAVSPEPREAAAMRAGQFDPVCPECGGAVQLATTDESAPFRPSSFYGLTKQVQEQMVLMYARTLGISGYALRYQNVYGPGQSLNNPYTGILAIFSGLAKAGKAINIFEDGRESRDFVYIDDVVEATARCVEASQPQVLALNVGSGVGTDVMTVAENIVAYYGSSSPIEVTGAFRLGDIRHNVADLNRLKQTFGFMPSIGFEEGLRRFLDWAEGRQAGTSEQYLQSLEELRTRGLMNG